MIYIPAWVVSALAFLAAISIASVRPMPWRIRLSMISPLMYFGVIYAWASLTPLDTVTRVELIRIGMVLIFIPIIINSLMVYLVRNRGRIN